MTRKLTLPTDSEERKTIPILGGCINYFPAALAGIARWSVAGNKKHNPGQPLHHARGKSMDHSECIIRHTMDLSDLMARKVVFSEEDKKAILDEVDARAWRALADSQRIHEMFGAPLAPAARLAEEDDFTKQVETQYLKSLATRDSVQGLVAGCAEARPYKHPELARTADYGDILAVEAKEQRRIDAMNKRLKPSAETDDYLGEGQAQTNR